MKSYKNPSGSWRDKDERNRKQDPLKPAVCEKYCKYNIHMCGRQHPWSSQCPPCTRLVTVTNVCGHDVVYECDIARNLASSFPCPTCGTVAPQNNQILMPFSSQQIILNPYFHQPHSFSVTTDVINYSIRFSEEVNSVSRQIVGLTISANPGTSKLLSMQMDYYPALCTKYCPNNLHICNVYHSWHDQCPPCSHIEYADRPCGHICPFMCYTALYINWVIFNLPCPTCQIMDNQNSQATFPWPCSSQTSMQQQPTQSQLQLTQAPGSSEIAKVIDREQIYQWINDLSNPRFRENALSELCKIHQEVSDMAEMLWYSFGSITSLLQEIVSIYPYIQQETLTSEQRQRVCKTIVLFHCVISHCETRQRFLQARIPLLLYPFLNIKTSLGPLGYLRLNTLGLFGTLVDNNDEEVVQFLLDTEATPLFLNAMETGNELCATAATYILYKILFNDAGLNYICDADAIFARLNKILDLLILSLAMVPSFRLLRYVIRCYVKLSKNARAREALAKTLPDELKDSTFNNILKDDKTTKRLLAKLLKNLIKPSSCQSDNPARLTQHPTTSTS